MNNIVCLENCKIYLENIYLLLFPILTYEQAIKEVESIKFNSIIGKDYE